MAGKVCPSNLNQNLMNAKLFRRVAAIETLENRELLSVNIPTGANLVSNSGFEDVTEAFVDNWNDRSAGIEPFEFRGNVQHGNVVHLKAGQHASQVVPVINGQTYVLSFEYRLAHTATDSTIGINGGPDTVQALKKWQTATRVIDANADSLTIDLVASDHVFVDNVRLVPVKEIGLANGSFEEDTAADRQYYKSKDFTGWNSVGDRRIRNLNVKPVGGSQGDHFLNLDGNRDQLDRVFRDIATESGQSYYVAFDIRGDSGNSVGDNEMRVRWNNQFAGVFDGTNEWTSVGFFGDASSGTTRLLFREAGRDGSTGDGNGPFIDNVRLFQVMPGQGSLTVSQSTASDPQLVENNGPVSVFNGNLVLDNTVNQELTGAVVKLVDILDLPDQERLAVDVGDTGIQARYDAATGRLRLTGRRSVADYQAVLNTLSYNTTSEDPSATPRKIRLTIDHERAFSAPEFVEVTVTPINDRPEIPSIGDQSVTVLTSYRFNVNAFDEEDPNNLTYSIHATGTALGNGDPAPTISSTGDINWVPQQSGIVDITVTVRDPEGLVAQADFSVEAVLDAPVPDNFAPFSGARQLSNVVPSLRNSVYSSAPGMNIDLTKEYRAIFQTDDGEIEVLLYDNDTPITVNNFVNLARDGYYDGLTFHRVISLIGSPTDGFIAQGGDPKGDGTGGPGYGFGDENLAGSVFDKPVIAMANRGVGTNSNGSQFFFTYDDQVQHLNGNHTVFGEITHGLDVVNRITKRSPGSGIPAQVIRKVTITEA